MTNLEDFHQSFVQLYLRDASERGFLVGESFFDKICNNLSEEGEISSEFTYAKCEKKGIDISGYSVDYEKNTLTLINQEICQNVDKVENLSKLKVDRKFKHAENYFEECKNNLHEKLEETSDEYKMSLEISDLLKTSKIDKVRYFLLSDGTMPKSIHKIEEKQIDNIRYEYRVIDIEHLYNIEMAYFEHQNFEVDVNLPFIQASTEETEYKSYLAVISGEKIAEIYEQFGSKLLEQNVRTFLQFRGKVNKGLRTTILKSPGKFFAYNNGVTATASNIDIDNGKIVKIYDLQIVNGGQTVSAIYAARKRDKLDLSYVNVQMKLSVVTDTTQQNEFVSKVAEYANTQNKVNKSDFFSNSPFHKEMKDLSKRIFAPSLNGSQKKTKWFYERVRGEYLNEQAYLTQAEKRTFLETSPKHQLIDKTLLSKAEMAWIGKPFIVSKGAQFCFLKFAENITSKIEDNNMIITDNFFKEAISKIIMFKHLEKNVSKASWYNGGYRAQIVAYTISYLAYDISKNEKYFNFDTIWEMQSINEELNNILMLIASNLYKILLAGNPGDANIGTWAKKEICWKKLKVTTIDLHYADDMIKDKETIKTEKRRAKKEKKIMNGIEAQIFAVKYPQEKWNEIFKFYSQYKNDFKITDKQLNILKRVKNGEFPSGAQSQILYSVYEQAIENGVVDPYIID